MAASVVQFRETCCGCKVFPSLTIQYCPTHEAAFDAVEALAGYIACTAINGGYTPDDMSTWVQTVLKGKTRTPVEVAHHVIAILQVDQTA